MTRINVMLPQVAGLGVWRLESHGYYAAAELPDMLELLQQVSGGRIIGGILRIEQRSSKKDGKTNRYPVPVLDLPNVTLASLTGGGMIVNPPRLEPGKPPLLTGAEMPADTAFATSTPPIGPAPALPQPALDRRAVLAQGAGERGLSLDALEQYATLVGIKKGTRATDDEMDRLIEAAARVPIVAILNPASGPGESSSARPAASRCWIQFIVDLLEFLVLVRQLVTVVIRLRPYLRRPDLLGRLRVLRLRVGHEHPERDVEPLLFRVAADGIS